MKRKRAELVALSLRCLRSRGRSPWLWPLAVVIGLLASASAIAAAPKVAESQPKAGDNEVDPKVRRLRVVFDQPMDHGGFSFVGGGETFPKVTGKPRWLDDRTCILPVRLEANRKYTVGINSPRFQNFKNVGGEAAVPYEITFRTGARAAAPDTLTEDENRQAVAELRRAIDMDYSYRDLHDVNWEKLFDAAEARLVQARTAKDFAAKAAEMLKPAKDLHLWLDADGEAFATTTRSVTPNVDLDVLRQAVPGFTRKAPGLYAGRFDDGIGYLLIASWDNRQLNDLEAAYTAIEQARDAAIIIDVRPSSGGDELLARQFAGCFIESPKVYAKNDIRSDGKFSEVIERVVEPNRQRPKFRGRVAVLMGLANMSSCESFLLMMKQVPGYKLIGERSYGSSGNPQPIELANGVIAYVPSWRDLLPDGTCFEGRGIEPDLEVKASGEGSDAVLEAALRELRRP